MTTHCQFDLPPKGRRTWLETSSQQDLVGTEVYDRDHHCIGVISDVYCDREDLTARYVEVVPLAAGDTQVYLYPFEMLVWQGDGPIFLGSTYDMLRTIDDYKRDAVLADAGESIIPYNEALDLGFDWELQELYRDLAA